MGTSPSAALGSDNDNDIDHHRPEVHDDEEGNNDDDNEGEEAEDPLAAIPYVGTIDSSQQEQEEYEDENENEDDDEDDNGLLVSFQNDDNDDLAASSSPYSIVEEEEEKEKEKEKNDYNNNNTNDQDVKEKGSAVAAGNKNQNNEGKTTAAGAAIDDDDHHHQEPVAATAVSSRWFPTTSRWRTMTNTTVSNCFSFSRRRRRLSQFWSSPLLLLNQTSQPPSQSSPQHRLRPRRRRSSLEEHLPQTPSGWAVLLSTLAATLLAYEIQLQQSLTAPPLVFGQCRLHNGGDKDQDKDDNTDAHQRDRSQTTTTTTTNNNNNNTTTTTTMMQDIYNRLTATPHSILRRTIQPSLWVGTRGYLASAAAYLVGGPSSTSRPHSTKNLRVSEIMTMTPDGAEIVVDWELPPVESFSSTSSLSSKASDAERIQHVLHGPMDTSVVLILHGMNNHARFGYIQSLMRACCEKGWIAAGLNFRGCCPSHQTKLTTPRGYNAGYTGDLRCVIQRIVARMAQANNGTVPYICLVGHSLGANLVAKYLGEEGLSGTLPDQVVAGVTLGNPMWLQGAAMDFPYAHLLGLGVKKTILEQMSSLWPMMRHDAYFRQQVVQSFLAVQIRDWDRAMAPLMVRNDRHYPFGVAVGYESGEAYWQDSSSYRLVRYISVPTLQIMAADDMLCHTPFQRSFSHCLANPLVLLVETRCGGHLGWQESPPPPPPRRNENATNQSSSSSSSSPSWKDQWLGGGGGGSTSWANVATTDFIEAVLDLKTLQQQQQQQKLQQQPFGATVAPLRSTMQGTQIGYGDADNNNNNKNNKKKQAGTQAVLTPTVSSTSTAATTLASDHHHHHRPHHMGYSITDFYYSPLAAEHAIRQQVASSSSSLSSSSSSSTNTHANDTTTTQEPNLARPRSRL
ncbi:hypothetical protein ACA910_016332 [Epithemia clementina (nom. ined.)]